MCCDFSYEESDYCISFWLVLFEIKSNSALHLVGFFSRIITFSVIYLEVLTKLAVFGTILHCLLQ